MDGWMDGRTSLRKQHVWNEARPNETTSGNLDGLKFYVISMQTRKKRTGRITDGRTKRLMNSRRMKWRCKEELQDEWRRSHRTDKLLPSAQLKFLVYLLSSVKKPILILFTHPTTKSFFFHNFKNSWIVFVESRRLFMISGSDLHFIHNSHFI